MSTRNTTPNEQHPKKDADYHTNVTDTLRKIDSAPSNPHARPDGKDSKQVPVDLVEEESMESFPASDPPAYGNPHNEKPEPRRPE